MAHVIFVRFRHWKAALPSTQISIEPHTEWENIRYQIEKHYNMENASCIVGYDANNHTVPLHSYDDVRAISQFILTRKQLAKGQLPYIPPKFRYVEEEETLPQAIDTTNMSDEDFIRLSMQHEIQNEQKRKQRKRVANLNSNHVHPSEQCFVAKRERPRDIKVSTGIPVKFLRKVDSGGSEYAMKTQQGDIVQFDEKHLQRNNKILANIL